MNDEQLRQKLIEVARAIPINDRAPFAFEKRVMAHILARPALDLWSLWGRLLWRATAPCVAVMTAIILWSYSNPNFDGLGDDLAFELEQVVLAPLAQLEGGW